MTTEVRERLKQTWGPEIVLRCCKDWPAHLGTVYGHGGPGRCGICRQVPEVLVSEPWKVD